MKLWPLRARLVSLALTALLLASCAAPRLRPDTGLMAAQELRERTLVSRSHWALTGKLAISGRGEGGSGTLDWTQTGSDFRFVVSAPVTGKTWALTGNGESAELSGLREQPIRADDAGSLLERELGWNVPVVELASWVRGSRAPGPAKIVFREDGLPAQFQQNGWTIDYREYDTGLQPPLPRRIFASNGEYKVRLAIRRWTLP